MDVRASDPERDATVEQLRDAAAEGRLTLEELTDRIEAASSAVMRSELVPLTADLPVAVERSRSEPADVRKVGDIKRKGAWVVLAECRFRSYFGAVIVDLREATITARELRIDARTPFGNIVLLVPEGVDVEVRASALIGKLTQEQRPRGARRAADHPHRRHVVRRRQDPAPADVGEIPESPLSAARTSTGPHLRPPPRSRLCRFRWFAPPQILCATGSWDATDS